MGLYDFVSGLLDGFLYAQPSERLARVFTRGFVGFCVAVAVLERLVLNMMFAAHG